MSTSRYSLEFVPVGALRVPISSVTSMPFKVRNASVRRGQLIIHFMVYAHSPLPKYVF